MTAASLIAQIAKFATKNGKDVAKIIEAASLVVTAAATLLEKGKPILDEIDTAAVAEKAKAAKDAAGKGAKAVADGAGKGAGAVKEKAAGAAGAMGDMFGKLGDAKDNILKDLAESKNEKELQKAIQAARQTVFENATASMTIKEFVAAQEAANKAGEAIDAAASVRAFEMPGCFVIATYKKLDFDKDLTDYLGIYVGKTENIAEGVAKTISREGNPDVYADVKFKQNVRVYIYNCLPEDLDERYFGLYQTFEAGSSYNAVEHDELLQEASVIASVTVGEALITASE